MIAAPAWRGAAFTDADEGDMRDDRRARLRVSSELKIPGDWATVRQVHGSAVIQAREPGDLGEADAVFTEVPGLPLAVLTADCHGVVIRSDASVGVAHAGWRGAASGVVGALREEMSRQGGAPHLAAIGPGIGPCCFEVGPEVSRLFPGQVATTSWGTESVDLERALRDQLDGLEIWAVGRCTSHHHDLLSHRRDGTRARMASIAWLP